MRLASQEYESDSDSGAIAQLGERNAGSVEVCGSIPHGSTTFCFKKMKFTQLWGHSSAGRAQRWQR